MKDIHRYSHSRLTTFKNCPRKHHYLYEEGIETEGNEYTIPGQLFHKSIEMIANSEDPTPMFDEFKSLCLSGKLPYESDLLEYIVKEYMTYYKEDFEKEQVLYVEKEYEDPLDDDDYIKVVVDKVYMSDGLLYIRDTKTTAKNLKYKHDDVRYNSQLLLYIPFVENDLNLAVNAIQIDEVRLAKLQPVPRKTNGKPSSDKRLLGLVTYEAYLDALMEMELQNDKEYQAALDELKHRGHPLFNRVTVQILDRNVINENSNEIIDEYNTCKTGAMYRNKNPLCNTCPYHELCELDMHAPDEPSRRMIVQKISKNITQND